MTREMMTWFSQRAALIENMDALLAHPGTTLIRPACSARIAARTTGAGCIIISFNIGVIVMFAAVANPVSDMPGESAVTTMPSRLNSR